MKLLSYDKLKEAYQELIDFQLLAGTKSPIRLGKLLGFWLMVLVAVLLSYILSTETTLSASASWMAGIFILASLLWVTEVIPLFATAILILSLQIVLLANPGEWLWVGDSVLSVNQVLSPLGDPILVLFFGGFILAMAATKEGVDQSLAAIVLRVFGRQPLFILLGFILITAGFSMWMSNTATTAMMVTLAAPVISQISVTDRFRKGLLLAIPFAANLGGMGTPIASPPNAVAVAYLNGAGISLDFVSWMIYAMPLMLLTLLLLWWLLWRYFKPSSVGQMDLKISYSKMEPRSWFVIAVFVVTVSLWLTDRVHGLPAAVVAMIPAVAFTTTGIIGTKDVNDIDWHILLLIAGGLALGKGLQASGLDAVLIAQIPMDGQWLFPLLLLFTLALSTFMSNTASANLVIPIAISLGTIGGFSELVLCFGVALSASTAMALPVSTPPNAIAYARGVLTNQDFMKTGLIIGLFSLALIILYFRSLASFGWI